MAVLPPDPLFCLKGDMGHIHSLCFIENSGEEFTNILISATEKGMVYFWDLERNRLKSKQMMGKSIQVIHSIDNKLITQEKDSLITLWQLGDRNEYEVINKYSCASGFCKTVLFENKLIVPQDNSVEVIDVNSMQLISRFLPQQTKLGLVMCVQRVVINANVYILAGYESGDIILWDYLTQKTVSHIKLRECITSITFDTITLRGICGNASNILQIFSIDKQFNISLKCEVTITNEGCNIVKLRHDRKIFVSGGWDCRLRLYSWKSLRLLAVLNEHKGAISDVQFTNNSVKLWGNRIMAASSVDGIISLWNLYN